ncbi:MAG TPA: DMP19 family protein [Candidatus Acidoferrum sp.]|nr:DMP19 family protein [Candidatus Acidoferrum sp.]
MNKNKILIDLSESEKTRFGKEEFGQQSFPQKVFSAIWAIESEVNNGGFSQYFLNSSAESAAFVAKALETIGAPETASICNRAITTGFPKGLPPTAETINSVAADFSDQILERLEPLDQEFIAYPHNLTQLLFAYVSDHPEEFRTLPQPDDD